MNPRLTNDAVADLQLSEARAELLEEIMTTPVLDRPDPATQAPRGSRRLVPVAAAAAVAGLLLVPSYLLARGDDVRDAPGPASDSASAVPVPGEWVVLDAEGWTATYVSDAHGEREVRFERGDASLDVHLRPAKSRDGYVEDRQRINHPRVEPGKEVVLLGGDALMWSYDTTDHTVIGAVQGNAFPEVRGSGVMLGEYLDLLGRLRWADETTFEAALPPDFVLADEQSAAIGRMLADIAVPEGFVPPTTEEKDRYQLGARVAGAAACAWLDAFAEATESGDDRAAATAADALAGSREWDVLHEMNVAGDYPEVVWDYAAAVQAGRVPEGYRDGLGCR